MSIHLPTDPARVRRVVDAWVAEPGRQLGAHMRDFVDYRAELEALGGLSRHPHSGHTH